MNALAISCANQITLNLSLKPSHSPRVLLANNVSNTSFKSHVTKSRTSLKTQTGSSRTQSTPRVKAHYDPGELPETFYEVLKIKNSENATFRDIEKAYKQMKKKYNPKTAPKNKVEKYTKRFTMVHEAYETLSDSEKRALYDKDLAKAIQQWVWRLRCKVQLDRLELHSRDPNSWAAKAAAMPQPICNYDNDPLKFLERCFRLS